MCVCHYVDSFDVAPVDIYPPVILRVPELINGENHLVRDYLDHRCLLFEVIGDLDACLKPSFPHHSAVAR